MSLKPYIISILTLFMFAGIIGCIEESIDRTPPGEVMEFKGQFHNRMIHLQWVNPIDEDWQGTVIYRKLDNNPEYPMDGELIYQGLETSVMDYTSIQENEQYFYSAFTYDYNGNYSAGTPLNVSTEITQPLKGAFLVVNSWGLNGKGEEIADGKWWLTFEFAKAVNIWVHTWNVSSDYMVRAAILLKINHEKRGDCSITIGVGESAFNLIEEKRFPSLYYNTYLGEHPFPDNTMLLDITEFAPYLNEYPLWMRVYDSTLLGGSPTGTVEQFELITYNDSHPYMDNNPTGDYHKKWASGSLPLSTINGSTIELNISDQIGELTDFVTEIHPDAAASSIIHCDYPTIQDIERIKQSVGVYNPDDNYNLLFDGKGTGFKPPSQEEYEIMLDTPNYITGLVSHKEKATVLPSQLDYSKEAYFPPIGDQGDEGSCVAFSGAYYIHTFYFGRMNDWDLSDCQWSGGTLPSFCHDKVFTPEFLYHLANEGIDDGSNYRNIASLMSNMGCPLWEKMPYDDEEHTLWPSAAAFYQAPVYRASGNLENPYYDGAFDNTFHLSIQEDDDIITMLELLNAGYLFSVSMDAAYFVFMAVDNDEDVMRITDAYDLDAWDTNHANTIIGYCTDECPQAVLEEQ